MWQRGGDIKVGVLVIGIKGTKWGKKNREGGDVAQGERTLRSLVIIMCSPT